MRVILDTNVFISGVFFGGPPSRILESWRDGRLKLVLSPEILDEYQRVADELHVQFPDIDLSGLFELLVVAAEMHHAEPLSEAVCIDLDDDKFLACALASSARLIVSGDKHLLQVAGYQEIEILKPRAFIEKYLVD
ncbi:MAG: putative toxin-antitoxin system toxin component, PIN family [Desulfuromonadales bacterium]